MAIDMVAIDEDNTLELELEHEIPSPKDTSQNPSCFQPSVEPDQRTMQLVMLFKRSG